MKIILLISALFAINLAAAQTDTLSDKNNPARQIASPNAGAADKTPVETKTDFKIEPEKNAETVAKIKQRTQERNQKTIRKYKGKKSSTTNSKAK